MIPIIGIFLFLALLFPQFASSDSSDWGLLHKGRGTACYYKTYRIEWKDDKNVFDADIRCESSVSTTLANDRINCATKEMARGRVEGYRDGVKIFEVDHSKNGYNWNPIERKVQPAHYRLMQIVCKKKDGKKDTSNSVTSPREKKETPAGVEKKKAPPTS